MRNIKVIQGMKDALDSKDKLKVERAVGHFDAEFQRNAGIIIGNEHALHLAASSYGLLENRKMALEYVRLAEWNGYSNFPSIKSDEHLKLLWNDPDFKLMFD